MQGNGIFFKRAGRNEGGVPLLLLNFFLILLGNYEIQCRAGGTGSTLKRPKNNLPLFFDATI